MSAPRKESETLRKETETVKIAAGYRAELKFVLVPRTSLTIATPDAAVRRAFASPGALQIDLPIKGTCKNLPSRDIPCTLALLVDHGGQIASHAVAGKAVMKVQGDTFEVKVDGKTTVVDLIEHQLVGSGKLGFTLTPDFPHAESATLAPEIEFNNAFELSVQIGQQQLVGDLVLFAPQHGPVFNGATLELRIIEIDEGPGEVPSPGDGVSFVHRWEPGARRGSRAWAIGFLDDGCQHFSVAGAEEAGGYEFSWEIWGASKSGGSQSLLLEGKNFLIAPRPRLDEFRLEHAPSGEGNYKVHGKIAGISSRAQLLVDVALVDPRAPEPAPGDAGHTVRLQLHDDGVFEGRVGHGSTTPSSPSAPAYAILSLPAAARDAKPGPFAPYLEYDDKKYAAWKSQALTFDLDAVWLASEEARGAGQPAPAPQQTAPGKLCANDIAVISTGIGGCKAALLQCDHAPFAGKLTNGKDAWAWIGSDNAPDRLFTFFHGFYRGVRVSKQGKPESAAGNHFKLGEAADAFKHPVVLAPRCASSKEEQQSVKDVVTGGARLGAFIDDALAHLDCLPKDASCGGGKYLSPLRTKDDVARHYLMAHSGGAKALGEAAVSDYAFAKPTFLVLLDSQYGYYQRKGKPDTVRQFVDHWKGLGKLGLGQDESRVLIVSQIHNGSGTNAETISIRDSLRSAGHTVLEVGEPKPAGVKVRSNGDPFPAAERQAVVDALRQKPIVIVWTPVSHDDIPTHFVPAALEAS
jgi:hypothetical protein